MHDTPVPSLEAKVAFLRQPSAYPETACRVEAIETHMSWVFLTDAFAYKLKKPVSYGVLDFREDKARRFFCEEELRLNRRLAPKVYIGVVPLSMDPQGHLQLGGDGPAVDWLVKMHRLPADRMLDHAIRTAGVDDATVRRLAAMLAAFYRQAQPAGLEAAALCGRIEQEIGFNLATLSAPDYHLPAGRIREVCAAQRAFLQGYGALVEARVRAGKIVEGHGDLRPEHVCLGPELAIIDCLEFSRELRTVDAAEEIAFLALECERLGAGALGKTLLRAYEEASGDMPDARLVHFYQSYRACTRARIAILHLDEERFRHSDIWRRRALDYLGLAERHAQAFRED